MKNKIARISIPYFIWMTILVLLPTIVIIILAFAKTEGFNFKDFEFSLDNFHTFFENKYYVDSILDSLKYGFVATVISLLIAFPVAYFVSTLKTNKKNLILLFLILPMWTNMLLRIEAWYRLFNDHGFLDTNFGVDMAIYIAMVSIYLPFMIFPIYTSLEKIDKSLLEAASDLGCNKFNVFRKVVLPLAKPGIISGIILVFLPAVTSFALPAKLGQGKIILIGNLIDMAYGENDFNMVSFISFVLLLVIFLATFKGTVGAEDEN